MYVTYLPGSLHIQRTKSIELNKIQAQFHSYSAFIKKKHISTFLYRCEKDGKKVCNLLENIKNISHEPMIYSLKFTKSMAPYFVALLQSIDGRLYLYSCSRAKPYIKKLLKNIVTRTGVFKVQTLCINNI